MEHRFPSHRQRLHKFIVLTVGGQEIQVVAHRYVFNRDAQTIDFYIDEDNIRDDLMLFSHGVVMIQRSDEEIPENQE